MLQQWATSSMKAVVIEAGFIWGFALFWPILYIIIAASNGRNVLTGREMDHRFVYSNGDVASLLGDRVCFLMPKTPAWWTLMGFQWSFSMLCVLVTFAFCLKNICRKDSNILGESILVTKEIMDFLKTILIFFTIGVCWFFLIVFIIPGVKKVGEFGANWADWTQSVLMFLQVIVLFVVVVWNHWTFLISIDRAKLKNIQPWEFVKKSTISIANLRTTVFKITNQPQL